MPPRLNKIGVLCGSVLSVALVAPSPLSSSGEQPRSCAKSGDTLRIDPPARSVGDIKAGSVTVVPFTLWNNSLRPIRVLGAEGFCTKWGCIQPDGLPFTIPPRSRREVRFILKAARSGDHDFSTSVTLYLDRPGDPTALVQVRGHISEWREH